MASAGEKALQAALKKRTFDPVYYFHGDDDYLKDARVRELVEAAVDPSTRDFNLEQRRGADLDAEALDSLLSTPPMLAERRVVVIREVDKLKKDPRRTLDKYLTRAALDTVLVLVSPSGVKADKLLSGHQTTSVEFAPLTGDRVPKWVVYHCEHALQRTIAPDAVTLLVEAVGNDLAHLATELEKLASFSDGEIDERAVSEVVGIRRGESVGDLLDAIAARDAARALAILPGVLEPPRNTPVLLVMYLSTQVHAMAFGLVARERGVSAGNMYNEYAGLLKSTGAFPGQAWGEAFKSWTKHLDRWTEADFDAALAALLFADEAFKETKLSSLEQLFRSLVLSLCGAGSSRRAA